MKTLKDYIIKENSDELTIEGHPKNENDLKNIFKEFHEFAKSHRDMASPHISDAWAKATNMRIPDIAEWFMKEDTYSFPLKSVYDDKYKKEYKCLYVAVCITGLDRGNTFKYTITGATKDGQIYKYADVSEKYKYNFSKSLEDNIKDTIGDIDVD